MSPGGVTYGGSAGGGSLSSARRM